MTDKKYKVVKKAPRCTACGAVAHTNYGTIFNKAYDLCKFHEDRFGEIYNFTYRVKPDTNMEGTFLYA